MPAPSWKLTTLTTSAIRLLSGESDLFPGPSPGRLGPPTRRSWPDNVLLNLANAIYQLGRSPTRGRDPSPPCHSTALPLAERTGSSYWDTGLTSAAMSKHERPGGVTGLFSSGLHDLQQPDVHSSGGSPPTSRRTSNISSAAIDKPASKPTSGSSV